MDRLMIMQVTDITLFSWSDYVSEGLLVAQASAPTQMRMHFFRQAGPLDPLILPALSCMQEIRP
jgi:hypothetical protein|tara:strand:+ start:405 stop:596 length:192 start_codon:yes stop_codon:yes gene_type:complete